MDNLGTAINIAEKDKRANNPGIITDIANADRRANPDTNTNTADTNINRGANNPGIRIINADGGTDNPGIDIGTTEANGQGATSDKAHASFFSLHKAFCFLFSFLN